MFWPSPPWDKVVYWALDLETGGFDTRRDPIISVGMVPIREGVIRLGEAYQSLVRPEMGNIREDSIAAHQLVPGEVESAPRLVDVLREVAARLNEGALLVHNAGLDVRFLRRAHDLTRIPWPRPRVVDTVNLIVRLTEKNRFIRPDTQDRDPPLNLGVARARLGLPGYAAHDALTDAIATAELFLMLRRQLGARTLRELT